MTKTDGTVTAITTHAAGAVVVRVTYPPDPPAETVDYPDPDDDLLDELKRAQDHGHKVDVSTDDTSGDMTAVKVH